MIIGFDEIFAVLENKSSFDNPLETDKTLNAFMDFVDNFAPADSGSSAVFESALIDCINLYQKRAFEVGFKAAIDMLLNR